MANDLVKRMVKKDGSQRISFYREDYAENPRDMTDEPLHCEDWSRDYSIMDKKEREQKCKDARNLIEYLLKEYGDYDKIVNLLVENGKHMTDGKSLCNNAFAYDRSAKRWVLKEYTKWYGEKEFEWKDSEYFDCKKTDIDAFEVLESVLDSTIDFFIEQGCLTDKVKVMSYGFGYYGDISFYHEFSTDSEGICWLEKDEFLKYSGCKEEYWKGKSLDEIEFLIDELKAWTDNDVYGFVVEDAVKYKTTRKCLSGNGEDEEYDETEWEEKGCNSCWGFYGELDKMENFMFDEAGLNKEEFDETAA